MQKTTAAFILLILLISTINGEVLWGFKKVTGDYGYFPDYTSFYPKYEKYSITIYEAYSNENAKLLFEKMKREDIRPKDEIDYPNYTFVNLTLGEECYGGVWDYIDGGKIMEIIFYDKNLLYDYTYYEAGYNNLSYEKYLSKYYKKTEKNESKPKKEKQEKQKPEKQEKQKPKGIISGIISKLINFFRL